MIINTKADASWTISGCSYAAQENLVTYDDFSIFDNSGLHADTETLNFIPIC